MSPKTTGIRRQSTRDDQQNNKTDPGAQREPAQRRTGRREVIRRLSFWQDRLVAGQRMQRGLKGLTREETTQKKFCENSLQ